MVIPGPGEIQLIGYDPNQPTAPAASNIQNVDSAPINYDTLQEVSQQTEEDISTHKPYIVTLQFRVVSVGPTNAVITCLNGDAEELINIGAELIV